MPRVTSKPTLGSCELQSVPAYYALLVAGQERFEWFYSVSLVNACNDGMSVLQPTLATTEEPVEVVVEESAVVVVVVVIVVVVLVEGLLVLVVVLIV